MADPTMQTFCCHRTASIGSHNKTDVIGRIMMEFNTDAYNIVCLFASGLGILGAIYQILPRRQFANNHRLTSISAIRARKIIRWLAVADLMAASGMFVRAMLWLNTKTIMPALNDNSSVLFCALSSAWTQYFYTATWIWTLCYALDMRLLLADHDANMRGYHLSAWLVPAFTTIFGLSILYLPNATCHTTQSLTTAIVHILPNYLATYVPMVIVMVANPCLYAMSMKGMERAVTSCYCQLTGRERDMMDAIRIKFAVINIVFYICWLPNLMNAILLWCLWFHLPVRFIITIWYVMAFTNPLQALFNCLVYRRWSKGSEQVIVPWWWCRPSKSSHSPPTRSSASSTSTFLSSSADARETNRCISKEEKYPLLGNATNY